MKNSAKFGIAIGFFALLGGVAVAQHQGHAPTADKSSSDGRQPVAFPAMMADHILSNMRDHLAALQEIQSSMGAGAFKAAANIAEQRLGMSSLGLHGADHSAQFMPKAMQDIGSDMHRAASRFAIAVLDSEVSGDLRPALTALSDVTHQCVGCHAGFKIAAHN